MLLDGNQVVGWCDISPHERPVHSHCGTLGMGLLPSHRGMGLGGWLLENALAQAERRGYRRIELTVRADNPAPSACMNATASKPRAVSAMPSASTTVFMTCYP
ncbi:Acetyltransferase (GNAT) family [Chromobacterium violaceum]|uniref:Acetyltransferase (GNAT) family n=1 Tax=Chromobacterium violaceum TaxID=536 RepID=A0A3S4IF21_CHRVL|nr:Acetyltransferase (GNAT) family [Chromobacterium violaceum]